LAFNTAASFTTNTNWQNYAGEVVLSYFTQMAGLAYHNFTSAAVGITVGAPGYVRPEDALQDAAIALHRAKAGTASSCELYNPAMRDRAISRLRVETDLRNAIDREQFEVVYQPIVAIATGYITGFEALARWCHPVRGLIGPTEFIPVAEDTGLIRQLGRQILAESCRQMIDWQRRFGAKAPGVMCVNVSGLQLAHLDLANDIEAVLRETGLLAMIGKAERGPAAIEAIKSYRSPYLIAVGGAAYLISKSIKSARMLAFEDLGMEAIHEFEVKDMPVTVAVDVGGKSIHRTGPQIWRRKIAKPSI